MCTRWKGKNKTGIAQVRYRKMDKNSPKHAFTLWRDWGLPAPGRSPFLTSFIQNLSTFGIMSGAGVLAGAHHFVARHNTFIDITANSVSRMVMT